MRYLSKTADSQVIREGWHYRKKSDRPKIRNALLREQTLPLDPPDPYCANSEAYMRPLDSANIEHFDDRKKGKDEDDYWNWYAVLPHMNFRKQRIEKHLPILSPFDASISKRIRYVDGEFCATDSEDVEATNLLNFLGMNCPELAAYRVKHVCRMREIRDELFENDEEFVRFVRKDPTNLQFISALECEFGYGFT